MTHLLARIATIGSTLLVALIWFLAFVPLN